MKCGPVTTGAKLLDLKPIGVIAPVLFGDVVAFFALLACQGDLWTHVAGFTHDLPFVRENLSVAEAGLEPTTQRL